MRGKILTFAMTLLAGVVVGKSDVRWEPQFRPLSELRVMLEDFSYASDSPARGYPLSLVPMPTYPSLMVRAGVPGETVVRVHVGADGLVNKATVLKTTQPEFSPEAALNVVKHWRFLEHMDPWVTTKRGMIIDCRIVFTIDES